MYLGQLVEYLLVVFNLVRLLRAQNRAAHEQVKRAPRTGLSELLARLRVLHSVPQILDVSVGNHDLIDFVVLRGLLLLVT